MNFSLSSVYITLNFPWRLGFRKAQTVALLQQDCVITSIRGSLKAFGTDCFLGMPARRHCALWKGKKALLSTLNGILITLFSYPEFFLWFLSTLRICSIGLHAILLQGECLWLIKILAFNFGEIRFQIQFQTFHVL